jgi:uncharacterized membrane protein
MLVEQFTKKVDLLNCVKNFVELSKRDNEDSNITEYELYDIIKRKNTANKTKRLLNILRNEKRKNIDSIKGCIKFKNKVFH